MPDIEIASAFEKVFYNRIVRITARLLDGEHKVWQGTGCVIGYALNRNYNPKAVVATAGHVLREAETKPVEWTLERYETHDSKVRKAVFKLPCENPDGPKTYYHSGDPRLDIGVIFAEADCTDGRPFLELDDLGKPAEPLLPIIHVREGVGPGTRVAWAGFPASVYSMLRFPEVCYYEGVVGAMVNTRDHPPLYLLDGHNTSGVSGGPVWWWSDKRSRAELVAIVVQYLCEKRRPLPGFVCATPIHPLLEFLAKSGQHSGIHPAD